MKGNFMNTTYHKYFVGLFCLIVLFVLSCAVSQNGDLSVKGKNIQIKFNEQLQSKIVAKFDNREVELGDFNDSEYIAISGKTVTDIPFVKKATRRIKDEIGSGKETNFVGENDTLKKEIAITIYKNFPTMAVFQVTYTNKSESDLLVESWTNNNYTISAKSDSSEDVPFWSFNGGSYTTRPDWILPIKEGFEQQNYMGMNHTDYGGGTPVSDVWHREAGLAVGHLETVAKLVSLPITMPTADEANVAVTFDINKTLKPGESVTTFKTFVSVHTGDNFSTLSEYSRMMDLLGIKMPDYPETSYEPIWCAWGYERNFKTEQIYGALPKAKELGFEWAVLDDGFQTGEGDWTSLIKSKFPKGEESMKEFVDTIHEQGMKAKLWWAPMAVDPGTDLIKEHPEYLLLNEDGSTQDIEWWDSYYLCPADPNVQKYTKDLVVKFMKDWGYDGLKIDGQHLNGAPPCYNPAHNHKRPEESVEGVAEFFKIIYETARSINPDAVVEICPCGATYAFHTLPYNNQPVASDPMSNWQIRLKGKTFKALMGPQVPYYGDHVEHSASKDDFAITVGIGGVIGTKFTWPVGSGPRPRTDLTPEKEAHFKKWVDIYNEKMLPKGNYRGDLYDIGFDRPEAHANQKEDKMYYAFYADNFDGTLELRGLDKKKYSITDYVADKDLGQVEGPDALLKVSFENNLLIELSPIQ